MSLRIAILFDDTVRPETTGMYCLRALEAMVRDGDIAAVEHVLPCDTARLAATCHNWDIVVAIDDGLAFDLPPGLPPVAWWAIDTHVDFDRCLARSQQSRWTFAAQRDGVERLQEAGIGATWLPLACDPEIHGRQKVEPQYDISFVGHVFPGERSRLLNLLRNSVPQTFVGQKHFSEMSGVYSASKLVFNRSIANDINMRVFEGLCSGSLLVTNDLNDNGQTLLFQDGQHLLTYSDDGELLDKVRWYLTHDAERQRIAEAGREEVLAKHTYRHRMEQLLEVVCASVPNSDGLPTQSEVTALPDKSFDYFEFDRPDVQELVPLTARRILDVGCGAGRLGASLKSRQTAEVTGLEFNPEAASHARSRLDDVRIVNLETADIEFPDGQFDCVICADILEHLRQPERLLRKVRRWLTADGCLVVSLPNVRHHSVVRSLLAGNWTYESAGLLDADHVRFFTRRELEKLLYRCGFDIDELRMVPGDGYDKWVESGRPLEVSVGGLQVRTATADEAAEFFTYQYLVRCCRTEMHRSLTNRPDLTPGLRRLADKCAWPKERPDVPIPQEHLGWMGDGTRTLLRQETRGDVRLVVELGAWLGLSTRFLAEHAPQAKIVTIDHWQGNPEHHRNPAWNALLPTLYETFQSLSWDFRDCIQPIRMSTLEGLQAVAAAGLEPDLIFVDASHEYDAVHADLTECRRLFPQAVLVGDDYDDPDVQRAVQDVAQALGQKVETAGSRWRAWKLVDPARPRSESTPLRSLDHGLTSIVLVTWNELAYTRMCLDSIRLRTDESIEIIVVDNGSTDGTVEYLRAQSDVRLLENGENLGFPAAANQGLQMARGSNLLLLNNDTVVTTGWLRRMLDVLHSQPEIGLVGPVSNCVSGEQQILAAYDNLTDLDGWAWQRQRDLLDSACNGSQQQKLFIEDTDRLVGFCLLMKREVLEEIGLLDEQFGTGCFEDDDFCQRALEAGYRAVIARMSFVHHFGSVTFHGSGTDLAEVLKTNEQLYHAKWRENGAPHSKPRNESADTGNSSTPREHAISVPRGRPRPRWILEEDPEGNLVIQPNTIRLSGCLIVRNNENTIRACLESLKPWVGEIVVVDTGSTDATPQICEELGARVIHWPWCDDFAAARNVSFDEARGEWLFWMDSDDILPWHCGEKLQLLADSDHRPEILGYVMQVHCPGDSPGDMTVVDHVKLIRNAPNRRFEFRIHEQILPSIRREGGDVAFTEIYVVHSGSDRTREGLAKKLERDFRLLDLELRDRPNHPFVLFNLGMTHADCGQHFEAIRFLQKCLSVSGPDESHVRKAYALMIGSLMLTGHMGAAERFCRRGRDLFPDDKELLFRQAMLDHQAGRLEESAAMYERILSESCERHFTSIDVALAGKKARHNLATVYEDVGKWEQAEEQWRAILREAPEDQPAWRGVGDCLLQQDRDNDVAVLCETLASRPEGHREELMLRGKLAARRHHRDAALRDWDEADQLDPYDTTALRLTCRFLFENGCWSEAAAALEKLAQRAPDDASVWQNLGIAQCQLGNQNGAEVALQTTLRLRPDSPFAKGILNDIRSAGWPRKAAAENPDMTKSPDMTKGI